MNNTIQLEDLTGAKYVREMQEKMDLYLSGHFKKPLEKLTVRKVEFKKLNERAVKFVQKREKNNKAKSVTILYKRLPIVCGDS